MLLTVCVGYISAVRNHKKKNEEEKKSKNGSITIAASHSHFSSQARKQAGFLAPLDCIIVDVECKQSLLQPILDNKNCRKNYKFGKYLICC